MKYFLSLALTCIVSAVSLGQSPLYLAPPTPFTQRLGSSMAYSVASLSSERVVVAYQEGDVWEGKVRVGNIKNNMTVEFGNAYTFTTDNSLYGVAVTKLTGSRFLLSFRTNDHTKLIVCEVTGNNSLTMGVPVTFENTPLHGFSQTAMSANNFIIAYHDSYSSHGKCALGRVNENLEVTLEPRHDFTASSISNNSFISLDTLSSSRFVIAYGYWEGYAVVGTIGNNNQIILEKHKCTPRKTLISMRR